MRTKHALAVVAAACLSAALTLPAQAAAGAGQRFGKLMGLSLMAQECHLELTPEQIADVDKLGPKLQQEAGISDDQMKDLLQELAKDFKQDDCPAIASHWSDAVPAIIAQAQAE